MLRCPHCSQDAVSVFSACRARPGHPATCGACGGSADVPAAERGKAFVAALLTATAGGAVAAMTGLAAFGVAGLVLALAVYALLWRRVRPVAGVAKRRGGRAMLAVETIVVLASAASR